MGNRDEYLSGNVWAVIRRQDNYLVECWDTHGDGLEALQRAKEADTIGEYEYDLRYLRVHQILNMMIVKMNDMQKKSYYNNSFEFI
jgi:hypothetical protein